MPAEARNLKLLAQDPLGGFGNGGEGMAVQIAPDGRRVLWVAHESAPTNFTAIDVSDPRRPHVIAQTALPHARVRSNSLDLAGDLLVVAYQTSEFGLTPAGFEVFDVGQPERPRSIGFFDAAGPASRGVHALWFTDGEYVHLAGGAPDFEPRDARDHQFYRIVDLRDPTRPIEVGRWWLPGTRHGDPKPPPPRHQQHDWGFRAHNTNVYPARPDRAYVGFLDAGALVLDIADKTAPRLIARWDHHPPFAGFTHTVLPLLDRELWVVTDETVLDHGQDWPKLVWVLDARDETNPVPISTCPAPNRDVYAARPGRFGAHNLHENRPNPGSWVSERYVVGTFFNAGVRVYDLRDPFRPEEVAVFVPETPTGSPLGAIQLNDVFVDDRGIVFTVDRWTGGLYVLELTLPA
jgi:hypothetical protein